MSESPETPAALLVTLARRAVADFHESRRPASAALEEADGGVDGGIAEAEAEIAFAELLAPLDERQRQVVEMRVREGRSSAQTGEALGITANYVDQILFRALKRLRAETR